MSNENEVEPSEGAREELRRMADQLADANARVAELECQLAAARAENERLKADSATGVTVEQLDEALRKIRCAAEDVALLAERVESNRLNAEARVWEKECDRRGQELSALTAEAERLRSENEKLDREHGAFCWFEAFYRENRDGSPNKLYSELDRLMKRLSDIRSALAASAGGQGKEGT